MAEYRYYLIPDAMTRAFPEQFGKQTPTEFFDNIADLEKRYHQLREMPYNNERTWNERARFPYARLVVGVDRQNPDGEVSVIQVRNGINYLCDDYRGPYADGSDAQIPQMAKKLVEVIGVDRVRPHTYTQRDGYTWVQVEKNMHITEWLYAHELCNSLQFTRFLNRDGRELFQVRDGQRVIETNADGTKRIRAVKSIDVTHAYVGHYGCHIQQYAEDNFRTGCYVAPEHPQPGDNLDKLQIYQITKGGCEYRFMNYAYSKSRIHAADYRSVYIANLPADYDLDRCFQEFNSHTLLSGAARHCGELPQILPRSCLAGRGAVSGHRLLSGTGRFAGHRWQHHGASVGNAGAVGDPAGGSVYERKVHESHYQCDGLIPFGETTMIATKTNLEITEYREKFFLGLSLRQLACFAAAAMLAIATCFVCLHWLRMDMQVVSYIVMVEVLPFLGLGFIHRDGYPFEKLVKIYWAWHSENAAVPIRPYKESRNVQKKRTRRNSECETYCRRDEKAARKGRKAAVKAAAQIRKTIRNECRAERPQH